VNRRNNSVIEVFLLKYSRLWKLLKLIWS